MERLGSLASGEGVERKADRWIFGLSNIIGSKSDGDHVSPPATMMHILANFFRMIHSVIGITAPEPGHNERSFVLLWLALIAFFLLFCWFLFYLMMNVF